MRWLFRFLRNRVFLVLFGILLVLALIYFGGEMIGDESWIYRLLALIVVLMVVLVVLMIKFIRANRSSDEIEKSIKRQAEQQRISTRPDKQAEVSELQTQLERAIEQLKRSKLGRGKRGRAALYALPWYLFIGPPGAGKTTAITNSGLNFPLGSDRVRGVGGTRNCDWFFSDTAILLDTAGRYMTDPEDTEEWLAFLDTLKQHRSDRPINGAIVGIAIPDLALATPDEIEEHADAIRRRADELVQRLGVRFPVYLVFTKCDMLQGFVEFYGERSRREREQIWGCTLNEAQQNASHLRAVFEEEFDRLVGALIDIRMARLSRPMKREERQKVYAFPLQMASVKENLALFVGRLFQPNPYQENPVFRGFYFTSGTQEGIPLDRVIEAMARQFDLPATGLHPLETREETKSYFITDLFTDVIVPDQYMVRSTSKAKRQGSFRQMGVTVAATVLLGLFVLVAALAMTSGRGSLARTTEATTSTRSVTWEDPGDAFAQLGRVDSLRQQVDRLEKPVWFGLGLNRNSSVRRPTRNFYLKRVRSFVEAYPLDALRGRMNRAIRQGSVADTERDTLYDDLKAYLLLSQEQPRLDDAGHRDFLVAHLTSLGVGALRRNVATADEGELDARVRNQVVAFVEALHDDEQWAFAPETNLIADARSSITALPGIDGLYYKLRAGRDQLQRFSFTLAKAMPARYLDLFQSSAEVSGFFTREGFEDYVVEKIDELSEDPTGEDWVLGRSTAGTEGEFGNKGQVEDELLKRYFRDYAREWQNFLRSVRVKGFSDVRRSSIVLGELGNEYQSPLAYLLARVTTQTRFLEPEPDALREGVTEALTRRLRSQLAVRFGVRGNITLPSGEKSHLVDQYFSRLHALKADQAESGGASSDFYSALQHLQQVGSALDEIAGDDVQIAVYAAGVLEGRGGDLDVHLQGIQRALRGIDQSTRQELFEAPIGYAWGAVMNVAQQRLNEQWRDQVVDPFQATLAGRYPFSANSPDDAVLTDVQQFFMPQTGPVDAFIESVLQPYLIQGDVSQPRKWQGRGLEVSRDAAQAIQKAKSLSNTLLARGSLEFSLTLRADQPTDRSAGAPAPRSITLTLHGQSDTYLMGGRHAKEFNWPGTVGGASLELTTERGQVPAKNYEGDWALFRLFDEASVQCRTSTQCDVRWPIEGPGFRMNAYYDLERQSSSIPFNNLRGFFNFQPPRSLN